MTQQFAQRWTLSLVVTLVCLVLLVVVEPPLEAAGRNAYAMAVAKTTKGEKALGKGDNDRAEELFRDSIELAPMVPRPHLGLGAALVGQKRFEQALEVLEVAKGKYVAWDQKAAEMELERRQQVAQETLEFETFIGSKDGRGGARGSADRGPSPITHSVVHRLEAQNLLTRDRWNLEEIQRIPSQVYYLQGVANLRLGRRDEGISALELCLAINESHGLAHYNVAVALLGKTRKSSCLHLWVNMKP